MLFKDLKQGYPVYILDKTDGITAMEGKVVSVSQPRFQPQQIAGGMMPSAMQTAPMVVDVTIECAGETHTYIIPETSAVTYANNLVLSTEREGLLKEVEAQKRQSEDVMNSVPKHKKNIACGEGIMEEWNPVFADKKRQDERINGLEQKLDNLSSVLGRISDKLNI